VLEQGGMSVGSGGGGSHPLTQQTCRAEVHHHPPLTNRSSALADNKIS
jgi:hypothetical protein